MRSSVDVHNFLVEKEARHELFTVRGRLRTPERIAAVLELPADEVGRVVVFESDAGPAVALVASDRTPDPKRVKKALKANQLTEVSAGRASELTDFIPEAIPPVALPASFTVLMDDSLAEKEVLYFNGGDPSSVLKIPGPDLVRASEATVTGLV